jgi:hypothetical protein
MNSPDSTTVIFAKESEHCSAGEAGTVQSRNLAEIELPKKKTVLITHEVHLRIFILRELEGDGPGRKCTRSESWWLYL